jgi:hypothetical protein
MQQASYGCPQTTSSTPGQDSLILNMWLLFCRYLPEIVDLMQRHLQEWADAGEAGVKGLDALKLLTFGFIVQVRWGGGWVQKTRTTLCPRSLLGLCLPSSVSDTRLLWLVYVYAVQGAAALCPCGAVVQTWHKW